MAVKSIAEDIAAAIRWFNAGPALLIGHSLGARNALVAGLRYPKLVAAVVAIEFTPFIETRVFDELEERVGAETGCLRRSKRCAPTWPSAIRACRRTRSSGAPATGTGRRDAANGLRPLADPDAMTQIARGLREDLEPVLRRIEVPTLLIRGKDSKLVSRDAWARTRALRPDLRALELEDADHYVPEEVPGAVVGAICEFWGPALKEESRNRIGTGNPGASGGRRRC